MVAEQVFGQPVFELIEEHLCSKLACAAALRPWILRLVVRTTYVLIATTIAAAMPFFGVFVSLIGALTFWLPVRMNDADLLFGLLWAQGVVCAFHCLAKIAASCSVLSVQCAVRSANIFAWP